MIPLGFSEFSRQTERDFDALQEEIEGLVSPATPYLLRCRRMAEKDTPGMTTYATMSFHHSSVHRGVPFRGGVEI